MSDPKKTRRNEDHKGPLCQSWRGVRSNGPTASEPQLLLTCTRPKAWQRNQVSIQTPWGQTQGGSALPLFPLSLGHLVWCSCPRIWSFLNSSRLQEWREGSSTIPPLSPGLHAASECPRWSAQRVLQTLNEPTEYLNLIFYSALFITCVPLFHKGTEKEREGEQEWWRWLLGAVQRHLFLSLIHSSKWS